MKKDFDNKAAIITGGSRGIGLAIARELGGRGAKIALCARGAGRLERSRAELTASGIETIAVAADVTSPGDCRRVIDETIAAFGRIDILINNAGISMRAELAELDADACRDIVGVNLMGSIYPTLFAIAQLKQNKGSVVFTSSIAGIIGLPTASLYCAAKAGVRGFADALRCELAPDGVHVGVVYVGFTENDPEKTVAGAHGAAVSPDRPAHQTQAQVAAAFADLIKKRRRQAVLTPAGKAAHIISRLSPETVEGAIILSRKYKISEKLNMR